MEGEPIIEVQEFPPYTETEARVWDEGVEAEDRVDNRGEAPSENAGAGEVDVEVPEHKQGVGVPAEAGVDAIWEERKVGRDSEKDEDRDVFSVEDRMI